MPVRTPPPTITNAQRRAMLLADFEARLREVWPDDALPARNFDDLEAAATRAGDELAQKLMEATLKQAMHLPAAATPKRCPDCGRALQYSKRKRTVSTIRGPVAFERDHAYCRACRKGFFPR